jgi:copper chaperone
MQKLTLQVRGMTCGHCESAINTAVRALPGIRSAKSKKRKGETVVVYDEAQVDAERIIAAITATGYEAKI